MTGRKEFKNMRHVDTESAAHGEMPGQGKREHDVDKIGEASCFS